jgi:hypothetical protein
LEKVKSFMLFTLHSKSATEIAWWQILNNEIKIQDVLDVI